jgi:tetratricopeptide (TPR) repeat protein/transcriptional regulator with XRE-family HTH domain
VGLTQEELAERAGLSTRAISALEQGANQAPRTDTLALLADALALDVEERAAFETAARRPRRAVSGLHTAQLGSAGTVGELPLVGRTSELALVERHLVGSPEGAPPPVLLLAGEPGIGKSRLLREAARCAVDEGWTVLAGGCQQGAGQDPYTPLVDAVARHVLGLRPPEQRAALTGCAWLVRLLPELAALPGEPLPGWSVSPEQERRLMVGALLRYLRNVGGAAGTLLLLDDLQWAGADALDLLLTLARAAGEVPVRVVGAYRDTEVGAEGPLAATLAALAAAGLAWQHLLRALSPAEAGTLLDRLLADRHEEHEPPTGPARGWRARVVERAGGVPFFLVSQAQALRLGIEEVPADAVPWTVAQSVRQRIAALPQGARDLLAMAAVVGRVVPRALLIAVAGQAEREAVAALASACQARLLEEEGAASYRFAHDVIREVMEADLGTAQRTLLHREIARALEGTAGEPPVEALAYHYGCTDEHASAAYWLERAGDQAAAGFANATALQQYASARGHLARGGAEHAVISRLEEKEGDIWLRTAQNEQAQEAFARAREHAGTPARRAGLWCKESTAWTHLGDFARALAALAAAEAEGTNTLSASSAQGTSDTPAPEHPSARPDPLPVPVLAAIGIGRVEAYFHLKEHNRARAAAQQVVLLGRDSPNDATALATAHAQHYLGSIAFFRGELAHAEEHLRASLGVRQRLGQLGDIAWSWHALGIVYHLQGDLARAEECARQSAAMMESIGDHDGLAICLTRTGLVRLHRGDLRGAQDLCRRGLAFRSSPEHARKTGWNLSKLAEISLAQGDLPTVEDYARRALALSQGGTDHGTIALCHILLGASACARGDPVEALLSYRAARRLFRHAGLMPFQPQVLLGRAEVLLLAGRLRAAARLVASGRRLADTHGLGVSIVEAAVLEAELQVHAGLIVEAQRAAEEAQRLAAARQMRREEARAQHVLGRCALAGGRVLEARNHLRSALVVQIEIGAALDAAHTRLVLAEALATEAVNGSIPDEARTLVAEARAQFAASGAALDLARAVQMARAWADGEGQEGERPPR